MVTLDYSKFRFRIGDTIMYDGEVCEIVAYYFADNFNNFSSAYGYTIRTSHYLHSGTICSYNENGEHIITLDDYCMYIIERDATSIKTEKPSDLSNSHTSNDFSQAKPGDKVRIKKIIHNDGYQFGVSELMELLSGRIFTIKSIEKTIPDRSYSIPANYRIRLHEDGGWSWSDAMLELVEETDSIVSKSIKTLRTGVKNLLKKEEINIEMIVKKKKPKLTFNL